MVMSQHDLERLWPEGPAFAYRATIERLAEFEDGTTCPATLPAAQQCWDVRGAVQGLLREEANRLESARYGRGPGLQRTWLMTSRAVNMFCRIFLEGARQTPDSEEPPRLT
jgi:hypothetical protein